MVSNSLERPLLEHRFCTNSAQTNHALSITTQIGTKQCQAFRSCIFTRYPDFSISLAKKYVEDSNKYDYCQANLNLKELDNRFKLHDLDLMAEEKDLHTFADKKSLQCVKLLSEVANTSDAVKIIKVLLKRYELPFPLINPNIPQTQILSQVTSQKWWLKKILKKKFQLLDQIQRELALVNHFKQIYTSNTSVRERAKQKARNVEYLKSNYAVNSEGQKFDLYELYEHNVSNPYVRRSEMMARIKGFETVAKTLEDSCLFLTITAPAEKHASYKNSGKKVKNFDGSNPKEVNNFLCHEWELIRSKLDREEINFYGIRVVEPHHDGTPHWHLLLFLQKAHKSKLIRYITKYLKYSIANNSEIGCRLKIEDIDIINRSAVGYIAKYISKNIDGTHIEKDLYGKNAKSSAERIEAWACTWNIRQFQFFGGPSVTAWRELRRLRKTIEDSEIEPYRLAADAGDWAAYVMLMGGPTIRRKERPLSLVTEILKGTGELPKNRIIGIKSKNTQVLTRLTKWVIKSAKELNIPEKVGRTASAVRPDLSGSWTCVNNCTHSDLHLKIP